MDLKGLGKYYAAELGRQFANDVGLRSLVRDYRDELPSGFFEEVSKEAKVWLKEKRHPYSPYPERVFSSQDLVREALYEINWYQPS